MIWLFIGLALGIQLGYWAWVLHLWGQEVLAYLGAIRKIRKGLPLPKLGLIRPDDAPVDDTPSVVKPKTPRQLRIEQVNKIKNKGL